MKTIKILFFAGIVALFAACNSNNNKVGNDNQTDTLSVAVSDTTMVADSSDQANGNVIETNARQPVVMIYNFHVTNRCASCIAIEEGTTKTINTYFAKELKEGRIKRQIINVDDEINGKISEKYQAFGSGLFVTRVIKGKETTTDLTGDGFKFARNKEARFIEILKKQIDEYLK